MKPHQIVSARLPITCHDLNSPVPMPPHRLSPAALEQRVLQSLSAHADLYQLFCDACESTVTAPTAKAAADLALQNLSTAISASWQSSDGSRAEVVRDQPVYRKLPNGQHETIGYLMTRRPDGTLAPLEVTVTEGADSYRCFAHVSVSAREAMEPARRTTPVIP